MYIDANLLMSNSQAGWDGGTAASTSYIDTLAAGNGIAPGARFQVVTNVAFAASSGSPTLTVALETDSDSAFGTKTALYTSPGFTPAQLTATTVMVDTVIPLGAKRYLRTYYTVGGSGGFTAAGSVKAFIVLDSDVTIDGTL